jgi:hypothetical protein
MGTWKGLFDVLICCVCFEEMVVDEGVMDDVCDNCKGKV